MKKWIDAAAFLDSKMVRVTIMKKSIDHALNSIKLLNDYANKKGLTLLVENHNDLFSDINNHIQLAKEMAGKNFGLIADFGNYRAPVDRFEALKTICPYTKLISAKVMTFDKDYNHTAYDFDQCVRVMEENGYKGIYSIEQYAAGGEDYDYERITDWAIEHIKANLR
jgi:sugar phosphate isomerase/epimerase